ncbi:MAG: hypothetical protein PWP37_1575 [Thermotogota bacterium]|nr:hypothetical protein [Thermotogota bacterium]MDK2865383.1 hypothetical protein [Thermotogota bacterium]
MSRRLFLLLVLVQLMVFLFALTPVKLEYADTEFLYFKEWFEDLIPKDSIKATVQYVVDGDTIEVELGNTHERVRLIGVDTPETVHPEKPVEYFGEEASKFTSSLLKKGSEVLLTFDFERRDNYGRLLAYVWLNVDNQWILLNVTLILNGYGRAYTYFPFREDYMSIFTEAEEYASNHGLGMWKHPERIGLPASIKFPKASGILPIRQARTLPDFTRVKVRGVVTVPPGPFSVNMIYIQDDTGGIAVYARGVDLSKLDINPGDLLEIDGSMYTHRNNREITINTPSQVKKIGKEELPAPLKITTDEINNEELEGLLVWTSGEVVEIDPPKYYIDDGSGKGMVYIRENTGIDLSGAKIGLTATVTGVLGQYEWQHELWPRWPDDVETTDIEPPYVVWVTLHGTNTVDVYLNESIIATSVVPNRTLIIKGAKIQSAEVSPSGRVVRLTTTESVDAGAGFLRGVRDLKGNMALMFRFDFARERNPRILFDDAHGQRAGNADWTIEGGYSDFADALKEKGYVVDRNVMPFIDPLLLAQYDVVIIPEPNEPFRKEEIKNLLDFVRSGGGIFLIADHGGADRNGNGWDAVKIFNTFVEELGFRFDGNDLVVAPVKEILPSPLTEGVEAVGIWNGSTITPLSENISVAVSVEGRPYVVYGEYGKGKFVAIGDSSPFDDGTSPFGKPLHNGWSMYDDARLALNAVEWLLGH